jgi:hypothetical protein
LELAALFAFGPVPAVVEAVAIILYVVVAAAAIVAIPGAFVMWWLS